MDNPFATSRNGHERVNMYNPANRTLDIHSNGLYPSNVLSNLYGHRFKFDGVWCESMEGFLQSLKYRDPRTQRSVCALKGGAAKAKSTDSWQESQTLWWQGVPYQRDSDEFGALIYLAYKAMARQCPLFRYALLATEGLRFAHSIGEQDITKTIMTEGEFCGHLSGQRLRILKETRRLQLALLLCGLFFMVMAIFGFCLSFGDPAFHPGRLAFSLLSLALALLSCCLLIYQRIKISRLKTMTRRPS